MNSVNRSILIRSTCKSSSHPNQFYVSWNSQAGQARYRVCYFIVIGVQIFFRGIVFSFFFFLQINVAFKMRSVLTAQSVYKFTCFIVVIICVSWKTLNLTNTCELTSAILLLFLSRNICVIYYFGYMNTSTWKGVSLIHVMMHPHRTYTDALVSHYSFTHCTFVINNCLCD